MENITDNSPTQGNSLQDYKNRLEKTRKELSDLSNKYVEQYTKKGVAKNNIIEQWLDLAMQ